METNEVIDEIQSIIYWYRTLPMDYTGITELMYQRVQLATLMTNFSVELGESRIQWKIAEGDAEAKRRQFTKEYIDAGQPLSKAQEYGKYYSINEYRIEKELDGYFHSMRFFYESANNVLDALNQHISNLKREETMARHLGT